MDEEKFEEDNTTDDHRTMAVAGSSAEISLQKQNADDDHDYHASRRGSAMDEEKLEEDQEAVRKYHYRNKTQMTITITTRLDGEALWTRRSWKRTRKQCGNIITETKRR